MYFSSYDTSYEHLLVVLTNQCSQYERAELLEDDGVTRLVSLKNLWIETEEIRMKLCIETRTSNTSECLRNQKLFDLWPPPCGQTRQNLLMVLFTWQVVNRKDVHVHRSDSVCDVSDQHDDGWRQTAAWCDRLTLWGSSFSTASPVSPPASSSLRASAAVFPFIRASVWAKKFATRIWNTQRASEHLHIDMSDESYTEQI